MRSSDDLAAGCAVQVVVFTASLGKYADPLLDLLDKANVVSVRPTVGRGWWCWCDHVHCGEACSLCCRLLLPVVVSFLALGQLCLALLRAACC